MPGQAAPYAAPARARPFLDEVGADTGRLRVAFTGRPLFGRGAVHADALAGLQATARLLESLGHEVEEATPPIEPDDVEAWPEIPMPLPLPKRIEVRRVGLG